MAVGMVGTVFPDLNRLSLVVSGATIEGALGLPFHWDAIHTLGGVLVLSGAAAMAFSGRRRRAFVVLFPGAVVHLLTDGVKMYADGRAATWLFPVSSYRRPTPNPYVSSGVSVLAVVVVGLWWLQSADS